MNFIVLFRQVFLKNVEHFIFVDLTKKKQEERKESWRQEPVQSLIIYEYSGRMTPFMKILSKGLYIHTWQLNSGIYICIYLFPSFPSFSYSTFYP